MQLDTQQLFLRYTAPTARSERDSLIQLFVDRKAIHIRDRASKELRPATAREIAVKLSHIPTGDLYAFYKQCDRARSFSRYFYWALKPKD